jgi:hypothetical protein
MPAQMQELVLMNRHSQEKKRKSLDVAATPQAAKSIAELTESLTGSKKRKHAKVKFTEEDEPAAAGSDDM